MSISSFFIKFFSEYVGEDRFGNKYYKSKKKRFVVYKGLREPSKVPPMWHAWLHYMLDEVPKHQDIEGHSWQKNYIPNLTGTKEAYRPTRQLVSSDYQPWKPN
jgi:NADH:ubiquinone oxidoreductase subunit